MDGSTLAIRSVVSGRVGSILSSSDWLANEMLLFIFSRPLPFARKFRIQMNWKFIAVDLFERIRTNDSDWSLVSIEDPMSRDGFGRMHKRPWTAGTKNQKFVSHQHEVMLYLIGINALNYAEHNVIRGRRYSTQPKNDIIKKSLIYKCIRRLNRR